MALGANGQVIAEDWEGENSLPSCGLFKLFLLRRHVTSYEGGVHILNEEPMEANRTFLLPFLPLFLLDSPATPTTSD